MSCATKKSIDLEYAPRPATGMENAQVEDLKEAILLTLKSKKVEDVGLILAGIGSAFGQVAQVTYIGAKKIGKEELLSEAVLDMLNTLKADFETLVEKEQDLGI
jgi:hypothetical protein